MLLQTNTNLTTAGAGTLTAAALIGQNITRTGPSGDFTDTTDTAANLVAALSGLPQGTAGTTGTSWYVDYVNASSFTATLAGGTGVTVTAASGAGVTVGTNKVAKLLITLTSPTAATVLVLQRSAIS